jgi:hypothetical protein
MKGARPAAALALAAAVACGKRGDPLPPLARTPQPVRELAVGQRGGELSIRYVAPRTTSGGLALDVHEVEVLTARAEGEFLESALVESHRASPGETVVLSRPLPPPGTKLRVAARAAARGDRSALTSVVTFIAQPPPPAPSGLAARLTPEGVTLSWQGTIPSPPPPSPSPTPSPSASPSPSPSASPSPSPAAAPSAAASGKPSPALPAPPKAAAPPPPTPRPATPGFRVYRRDPAAAYEAAMNAAPITVNAFEDRTVGAGPRWCYVVRLALSTDPLVESAPSNEVCVDVKDVSPPSPPLGVATLVTADAIEVSWSPSGEADLAGYRVYRAAEGGTPARVVDLPAARTSWRDPAPGRGGAHFYTVTAIDQTGNESAPSAPAEGHLP